MQDGSVPDRYVIVVPVNAPETLAYLTDSFRNVSDVEVVADRRQTRAPAAAAPVERRTVRRTQEAFGCVLVRVERPPAQPGRPLDAVPPAPAPSTDALSPGSVRFRNLPLLRDG